MEKTRIQEQIGQKGDGDANRTNIIVNEYYTGAQSLKDKILTIITRAMNTVSGGNEHRKGL